MTIIRWMRRTTTGRCRIWVKSYGSRAAGPEREVRFCPRTDLIPIPNLVAHACQLCNRAEEYGHAGSSECAATSAVEQRKADRGQAAAATQTCLETASNIG